MQFTQFNAAPLYLNPGFTGTTIEHRFATSYRNQWTAIPGNYVNYAFSYDYNFSEFNSGVGLLFAREKAGTGGLGTTEIALLYSYHLKIDNKFFIQPGLKFNYITKGIDFNKLTFSDQLYRGGESTTVESTIGENVSFLDISAGVIIFSEKYWGGFSFNHLNTPNQTLINGVSPLGVKFSAHGGYKFKLPGDGNKKSKAKYFNTALHYKTQDEFDQLDVGMYFEYEPFVLGLWYRGIPLFKAYETGFQNNDAIAVILGYKLPERNFSFGYSYDLTISRLVVSTGGSHELSIIYEIASKRKKRRRKKYFVPCAKF